jgi:mRNA-binding protein PUF3
MILKEIPASEAAALASGLEGHVRNATQSKHANYVLQRIIEVMPVSHASFIPEELQGSGQEIARHRFGCRVFCRILEHLSPNHAPTVDLVEELFQDLHSLCNHGFGSFVVRHLLEFGLPEHRHRVSSTLLTGLVEFSKHKFASHVVEGAFLHCAPEDQEALARDLMQDEEQLLAVATHQFGRHVARALLRLPGGLKKEAVDALSPWQYRLKSSRYGKSVLPSLRAAAASLVNS